MADRVRVRFATNRNPVSGPELFGPLFRDGDPKRYVTGSIEVERRSDLPDTGWRADPDTLQVDPPQTADVKKAAVTGASNDLVAFAKDLAAAGPSAEAATGGYGLILLPGFASTFLDAMSRAAQVHRAYRAAEVFCFSWPANGKISRRDYLEDQSDARASAAAIAHALARLLAFLGELNVAERPPLNVVAHSMGTYALRHAIQLIRKGRPALIRTNLFEGALLMASDENYDGFSKPTELGPLLTLAKRVTVYRAEGDVALTLSQIINGRARLGHYGPDDLESFPKVLTSIDCTEVSSTVGDHGESHHQHQYYRLSPRVINDVTQVLAGKKPADIEGRIPQPLYPAGGRAWRIPIGSAQVIPAFNKGPGLGALKTRVRSRKRARKRAR